MRITNNIDKATNLGDVVVGYFSFVFMLIETIKDPSRNQITSVWLMSNGTLFKTTIAKSHHIV